MPIQTKYQGKYRIQSTRLKNYNYSSNRYYFITICTHSHANWFGYIEDKKMILSEMGRYAYQFWKEIPEHFNNISLDKFVIMPNHVHGILVVENSCIDSEHGRDVAMQRLYYERDQSDVYAKKRKIKYKGNHPKMSEISPLPKSIPTAIRSYKSIVSREINRLPNMDVRFMWQERYYDYIIRGDEDLNKIREYIIRNPRNWEKDSLYQK